MARFMGQSQCIPGAVYVMQQVGRVAMKLLTSMKRTIYCMCKQQCINRLHTVPRDNAFLLK